ncbi:hypothetical protein ACODM8_16315 [Vibrio ostreicida]|uniref:DUF2956 domain-containing protein n=1 Tax=Vibrio ostreicida TaxID=526588 RepID=A0ABT8C1C9_9VIBR|nr:hypothetical protein [Vibrio ostreicida]MDN3612464.1 hypothetical protein [Vibrio ostreicida]NPD10173.1 hypothetical protein [Vibrio ostreicida]
MAVVPKYKDQSTRYDPKKELTADQLHRFGEVANKAQQRRDEVQQRLSISSAARSAKNAAMKPVVVPKKDKPNTARYLAWLVVVMSGCLWLMYMTR